MSLPKEFQIFSVDPRRNVARERTINRALLGEDGHSPRVVEVVVSVTTNLMGTFG